MYRPVLPQPSGLLQHQPQRYSDRHRQQTISSGKYQTHQTPQTHRHSAAQMPGSQESFFLPDNTVQSSKHDDDKGIKSTLKKTHLTDPSRASQSDATTPLVMLKNTEKNSS